MSFRDSFDMIKEAAKTAKETVVDFVSEEIVDYESRSDGIQTKKRQLKQWVVTAGTACVSIVATVVAKKGFDSVTSGVVVKTKTKASKNTYLKKFSGCSHSKKQIEHCYTINAKDTSLDNLIRVSSNLESILESKGAVGRGLHEKASSVETMISDNSVNSIRFIASVRNQLVHEGPDTVAPETKRDYLSACERVLRDFKAFK